MTYSLPRQASRRRDVVLLFASYPIATWLLHQTIGDHTFYALAHILVTIAVLSFSIFRVGRAGRRIADDVDTRLDERQLALRNAAYVDAYRVVSGLSALGVLWIALGIDQGWWWVPTTYNEWNGIFWGLFILTTSLPAAFLSWREPDREEEPDPVLEGSPRHA